MVDLSSAPIRTRVLDAVRRLPLVVEPAGDPSVAALADVLARFDAPLEARLLDHGALLFRGWSISNAPEFEQIARALGKDLKNDYLGTSPRNALTDYVFSASELPPFYPIPQHLEMSFTKHPPRRLFFCCLVPNAPPGGETPLVDFRAVYRDLDPTVRARFEERGVRNVRNYAGPTGGSRLDPWKLKRWDEMFRTTDRDAVTRRCAEEGFVPTWKGAGQLRLVNTQDAVRRHSVTGDAVWSNHSQVFHLSAVPAEYARIRRRQGARYGLLGAVARAMIRAKRSVVADDDQAMHCTFGDGTPIADGDMDAVRDAIWRNMVAFAWKKGDVVAIDNESVSHGRMPYSGPRNIAVAWA